MRELIEDTIQKINLKTLGIIEFLSLSITLTDLVDLSIRTTSGMVAIVAGVLAWQNYRLKNKLLKKQIEVENQKLQELLKSQKHKSL